MHAFIDPKAILWNLELVTKQFENRVWKNAYLTQISRLKPIIQNNTSHYEMNTRSP